MNIFDHLKQFPAEQQESRKASLRSIDTNDYRIAPSGQGPLAATWNDKPHRLIYDLCSALELCRQEHGRGPHTTDWPKIGREYTLGPIALASSKFRGLAGRRFTLVRIDAITYESDRWAYTDTCVLQSVDDPRIEIQVEPGDLIEAVDTGS